jgi:uncharacterized membrane protein
MGLRCAIPACRAWPVVAALLLSLPQRADAAQAELSNAPASESFVVRAAVPCAAADVARAGRWFSKLHPVLVHFPIALVTTAAFLELAALARRFRQASDAARWCLLAAALATVATVASGWLKYACAAEPVPVDRSTNLHRIVGTVAGAWVLLLCVASEWSRRRPHSSARRWCYRLALIFGAVAVGVAGHFGGTLIYGQGYLSFAEV